MATECAECGQEFAPAKPFAMLCARCFAAEVDAMTISSELLAVVEEAHDRRMFTRDRDRDRVGEF